MYRFKRILGVIIIIALLGVGGYYIYKKTSGSITSGPKYVAEKTDNTLKLEYGNIGENLTFTSNPAAVNYGATVYPGATASAEKGTSFTGQVNKANFTTGAFVTSDPVDKVVGYYKQQFGSTAKTGEITSSNITYQTVTGTDVTSPVVVVYKLNGKTNFQLISQSS